MKILIYYHNDADGIMSAAVVKQALLQKASKAPKQFEFIPFGYSTAYDISGVTREKYSQVYVVDAFLGVESTAALRDRFGADFIWIDHHKTAMTAWSKADLGDVEGLRSVFSAACLLCWQYFYGKAAEVPRCVELVDKFDMWRIGSDWDSEVYPWQLVLTTFMKDLNDFDLKAFTEPEKVEAYIKAAGVPIAKYLEDVRALAQKGIFKIKFVFNKELVSALFSNSSMRDSLAISQYHKEHPDEEIKAYISAQMISPDKWRCSIYAADGSDFDVSEVAVKLGGGGHKVAAGFMISDELLHKFFMRPLDEDHQEVPSETE